MNAMKTQNFENYLERILNLNILLNHGDLYKDILAIKSDRAKKKKLIKKKLGWRGKTFPQPASQ